MAFLSGTEFRKRFAQIFRLNPDLTNSEAYIVLKENSFDVPRTCLDVAQRVRKSAHEATFWVPGKALKQLESFEQSTDTSSGSSQTLEESQSAELEIIIDKKCTDQKIDDAQLPKAEPREIILIEDSDDEVETTEVNADEWATDFDERISGLKRSLSAFEIFDESDADISSSDSDHEPEIGLSTTSSIARSLDRIRPLAKVKSSQESETRTTPWISKIAGTIFGRPLTPIGADGDQASAKSAWKQHREASLLAKCTGEKFLRESREKAMKIEYRAGDSILVELEDEIESKVIYARIVYLYLEYGESMAHIRYFKSGYDTILDQIAGPRELFLTSECANISMGKIRAKIRVDFCGKSDSTDDPGHGSIEEEYHSSIDNYFYRFNYDGLSQSFTEGSEVMIQEGGAPLKDHECCLRNIGGEKQKHQQLRLLNLNRERGSAKGLIYSGTEYRLKDFVYFVPPKKSGKEPYLIGQIRYIRVTYPESSESETETSDTGNENEPNVKMRVDVYERYDDHFQLKRSEEIKSNVQFAVHDERRVFLRKSQVLSPGSLDGHCIVMHIDQIEDLEAYKNLNDTFWTKEQIPRNLIKISVVVEDLKIMPSKFLSNSRESVKRLEREKMATEENGMKLRTLDIFSGAGGLSQGFHESGVIGFSYAIEFDIAACKTFKRNFPNAIVYNHDANKLLEWVVKKKAGLSVETLHDKEGKEIPKMPSRGDVDMIIGGPPCQGWSDLNRHKKEFCYKRELIATYLSYVDFYRPKYFLLENVLGLLDGTDVPDLYNGDSLLKGGAIKFIFRALTSLGYQCQHASLQAGTYGSPSSRTRVIFWASLPGYKLPSFPQATHIFNGRIPKSPHQVRRSAPHQPVTIGDCVLDLPPFEWMNPHLIIAQTELQRLSQLNRNPSIAQYSTLKKETYIGLAKQNYASKPLSEYQRRMRKSLSKQFLYNHGTSWCSNLDTERVCNVPLEGGANYRSISQDLLQNFLRKTMDDSQQDTVLQKAYWGRYGRRSVDDSFKVLTTKLGTPASTNWTLHPYLHRSYSVREFARAQGFPDSFTWDMDNTKMTDIYTQIGNAVPVPLARALGNELRKVLQEKQHTSRETVDDKDMVDREEITANDQADQNLDIIKTMARDETGSDEEIDDLVISQLEKEFNRSTDYQTETGSEEEDEKNLDTDEEVSDDSDVDIDADMKDQEDQESEDEDKQNWNTDEEISSKSDDDPESEDEDEQNLDTDEEISNESEVEVDEDLEGQAGQENFESEDESGQDLDADKKMAEESDVDSDEDMEDLDDLESADEYDTNENMDSEEEFLVNTRIRREERINTGGSKDDAIVIDGSE
ncbi:hypothetical protein BGAL_0073g00110 [Botrytis galanthina]|uniref:Cytosine-specific methyltransferase n=1 Tax=Botrytis galanthina TaxID=278940 RepID=A0A4S8R407_9HELO|nr:hypothetical protein BGAL_0073g00110 [Botrytis galanthina]